jgi:predicted  nucleic acid-binding Zn-ribbon protein
MMTVEPRRGVTPYQPREGAPVFLSDMIMELGFASKEHVEAAVDTARSSGETVGRILVREGRLSEDQLARALAARYGLNHIDLAEFEVDASAANLLPPTAAQRYRAVPVEFELDGSLLVAMADPSDSLALNDIAFMTKLEVHAAVAAQDLIGDLVGRLPLPPSENRGSGFPTPLVSAGPTHPPPAPAPTTQSFPPPAPPAATEAPPAAPSPPPADNSAELAALRAELESTSAALDDERSKHAASVAELRQELSHAHSQQASSAQGDEGEELEQARSELERVRGKLSQKKQDLEQARKDLEQEREEVERARREVSQKTSELDSARSELGQKSEELEHVRSELGHKSGELERARTDLAQKTGEVDQLRSDLEQGRTEVERVRSELEGNRGELAQARAELDQNRAELEEARAQVARAGEALRRLDELDEAEARVNEAHATVEKMRHDFELEREQHAATERDLRSLLATETQRHEALQEAQASMQKRVDALRTQNAALLDAYATAKRWSEEFARGAKELANTLEQPVLDDAVRAQQSSGDTPPPPPEGPGRFNRDDD